MSINKHYLYYSKASALFLDVKKRPEIMSCLADATFLDGYQYTELMIVDIAPIDTINEVVQMVHHISTKTSRFIDEYYPEWEEFCHLDIEDEDEDEEYVQFDPADCVYEEDLLIVLSFVCDYLSGKYHYLTPKIIVTPDFVAGPLSRYQIEADIARLMALFFHYIGIDPYKFELICWLEYEYSNDQWLCQELNDRPKKQVII